MNPRPKNHQTQIRIHHAATITVAPIEGELVALRQAPMATAKQ